MEWRIMDKVTSEDKLLAVIENHAAAENKKKSSENSNNKKFAWKEKFPELLKPRILNKVFAGLCLCITLYFVFDFYHRNTQLKNHFVKIRQDTGRKAVVKQDDPALNVDIQKSLGLAERRNIFFLILPEEKKPGRTKMAIDISKLLDNLEVVGIIWAGKNSQVMVEDKKENKTYLLRQGDNINKFRIKRINKDSVVVEREGKEWMIR